MFHAYYFFKNAFYSEKLKLAEAKAFKPLELLHNELWRIGDITQDQGKLGNYPFIVSVIV